MCCVFQTPERLFDVHWIDSAAKACWVFVIIFHCCNPLNGSIVVLYLKGSCAHQYQCLRPGVGSALWNRLVSAPYKQHKVQSSVLSTRAQKPCFLLFIFSHLSAVNGGRNVLWCCFDTGQNMGPLKWNHFAIMCLYAETSILLLLPCIFKKKKQLKNNNKLKDYYLNGWISSCVTCSFSLLLFNATVLHDSHGHFISCRPPASLSSGRTWTLKDRPPWPRRCPLTFSPTLALSAQRPRTATWRRWTNSETLLPAVLFFWHSAPWCVGVRLQRQAALPLPGEVFRWLAGPARQMCAQY